MPRFVFGFCIPCVTYYFMKDIVPFLVFLSWGTFEGASKSYNIEELISWKTAYILYAKMYRN